MSEKSGKDLLAETFSVVLNFINHHKIEAFSLVIIWMALFISLSYTNSGPVTTQSRASSCIQCGGVCSNTCWGAPWSTCDSSGRWGCDANCNIDQGLSNPWCEGTTQKTCRSGVITQVIDSPACGGGSSGPCSGRTGSICEGVGDSNGSVTVLNCTGSTQIYTCQKNHTRFTNPTACNSAQRTDNWSSYDGMQVAAGARGNCSVDSGGNCDIGQADIINNSTLPGVCWDVVKTCTNCTLLTPTSTPRLTPTPTRVLSPTPTPTRMPCNGGTLGTACGNMTTCGDPTGSKFHTECVAGTLKCASGLRCMAATIAGGTSAEWMCRNYDCQDSESCVCRLTPTPTPTTILARCMRLVPNKPLSAVRIGEEIVFTVGYTDLGLVEDIAFRIFKDGQILETRFQSTNPTSFSRFRFVSPGRYSFAAYVKSGGVWR